MDPLHELFRHHAWATRALIDHCAGLSPAHLQATVPGTAGTIHHTLVHLVAADGRYLLLLTGAKPTVQESAPPLLGALRERFDEQVQRWEAALGQLGALDPTIPSRGEEPATPHARNLLLLQALHHGNDHRTHVCTVLGAHGLPVPDISGWAYWFATHPG